MNYSSGPPSTLAHLRTGGRDFTFTIGTMMKVILVAACFFGLWTVLVHFATR